MSNSIYGYIYTDNPARVAESIRGSIRATTLGVFAIEPSELRNYPMQLLPQKNENLFCFLIGDSGETWNATYLIDGYDYDPSAQIELPRNSGERIELLARLLNDLIEQSCDRRMLVAVTDCDKIDEVKRIALRNLRDELIKDIGIDGPPNILYCVSE